MKFLSSISLFFLVCFNNVQVYCSDGGIEVEAVQNIDDFKNAIISSLGNDENLKTNLNKLIEMIQPALNDLGEERQKILFDPEYQLGAYFAEVIKNTVKSIFLTQTRENFFVINRDSNLPLFINPISLEFKEKKEIETEEAGEIVVVPIDDSDNSYWIFEKFFKNFFFIQENYPYNKNSIEHHMLKYMLVNFAIFAFDDRETIEGLINRIQDYDKKQNTTEQRLNTIFEILIDSAARFYAYRIKERQKQLREVSLSERTWIRTKDFFTTSVSDDMIIFLAKKWKNYDHASCATYFREKTLYKSLIEYGIDKRTAASVGEKANIAALGKWWQKLWQGHKYKIITGTAVTVGGIAALAKDQAILERIKNELGSLYNQTRGGLQGVKSRLLGK